MKADTLTPPHIVAMATIAAALLAQLLLPLPDTDAAQLAQISQHVFEHPLGQLFFRSAPYLDKPPLVFWLGGLSFALFGDSPLAYKLPSFIVFCGGIAALYHLVSLCSGRAAARAAAVMAATSIAAFLMIHDVRADTLLMGLVACSIAFLARAWLFNRTRDFVLFGLFSGLAMTAKGPIGLCAPLAGIVGQALSERRLARLFSWRFALAFGVCGLVLLPTLKGLYDQFGAHGIRFFLWEQSFGRLTGENVWKNDLGYTFFLHTSLWVFAPWVYLLIIALLLAWHSQAPAPKAPALTPFAVSGGLVSLAALSVSHYKLPHYLFVTYPYFIWCTAIALERLDGRLDAAYKGRAVFTGLRVAFGAIALAFAIAASCFVFSSHWPSGLLAAAISVGIYVAYSLLAKRPTSALDQVSPLALQASLLSLVLAFGLWPALFDYHAALRLAPQIRALGGHGERREGAQVFAYRIPWSHLVDFLARTDVHYIGELQELDAAVKAGPALLVVGDESLAEVERRFTVLARHGAYPYAKVSFPSRAFLDPRTRQSAVQEQWLLEIAARN